MQALGCRHLIDTILVIGACFASGAGGVLVGLGVGVCAVMDTCCIICGINYMCVCV